MKAETSTEAAIEKPILFSSEMVRAILDGRKTQTRRVIKHEARGADRVRWIDNGQVWPGRKGETYEGWVAEVDALGGESGLHLPLTCPYGKPGDRLWLREAFRHYGNRFSQGKGFGLIEYFADGSHGDMPSDSLPDLESANQYWYKRRPSIHMPRWASRITLEIKNVRVQRLWDISELDCENELGVEPYSLENGAYEQFANLWNKINGKKHPWESNPFCWVIEFKKL